MGSCVIFCAGDFDGLAEPLTQQDYLIAADGGLVHTQALGLTPDCILGDFDSLGYTPENALVFPVEKDDTDAMLAVRRGLGQGCTRFLLYGSLDGPRLDHTLANFQTLFYLAEQGARGWLIGKTHIVTTIQNTALTFPAEAQGILSVFCMGAMARGVTLSGLKYNVENAELSPAYPLGVSNHFLGQTAQIRVEDGTLLLIYDRENGLI